MKRSLRQRASNPVIFITGTDTGAGKTVLTSLLLSRLRAAGSSALALKPFCSGSRDDARRLARIQDGVLALDEVNPYFFPDPLAPLIAARRVGRRIDLEAVVRHLRRMSKQAEVLLVEGAGGLWAPLGEGYSVVDLIRALPGRVVIAARNRLGVINHTLLTVAALETGGARESVVVLMGCRQPDPSVESNAAYLRERLGEERVFEVPYLPRGGIGSGRRGGDLPVLDLILSALGLAGATGRIRGKRRRAARRRF